MESKISSLSKKAFVFLILIRICLKSFCLQHESEHFIISYETTEANIIDTVESTLEQGYYKVTTDLNITLNSKVRVNIYPNLQQFHNAIGWPNAPDWVIGVGNSQIYIVSPLNPGPAHHYSEFFEYVLVHEFTHICTNTINYNIPTWLSEGIACYEAGPTCSRNTILNDYNRIGNVPSFVDLSGDINRFASLGGYHFSLFIVKYLVETYGLDAVRELISSPDDYSVFAGKNEDQVEDEWNKYFITAYVEGNGLGPEKNAANFSLFPNPFISDFSIKLNFNINDKLTLILFNSQGKIVKEFIEYSPGNTCKFNASDLDKGLYYYTLCSGQNKISGKLVKK